MVGFDPIPNFVFDSPFACLQYAGFHCRGTEGGKGGSSARVHACLRGFDISKEERKQEAGSRKQVIVMMSK